MNQMNFARQDMGYLLTAYADGQLAPEGVMWVEEQLDANGDLRARLKEIRQLQAGLRAAFAGGAPDFVLDLPRREALLASAANPPRKKIRFQPLLWGGLAASITAVALVFAAPMASQRESQAVLADGGAVFYEERGRWSAKGDASQDAFAPRSPGEAGASYPVTRMEADRAGADGLQRQRGLVAQQKAADSPAPASPAAAAPVVANRFAPADEPVLAELEVAQDANLRKQPTVTATPSAKPAAPSAPPPGARGTVAAPKVEAAKESERLARRALTPSPAPQPPRPAQPVVVDALDDGKQEAGEASANKPREADQQLAFGAKARNAAPAKAAGPQGGGDKAVEQVPEPLAEPAEPAQQRLAALDGKAAPEEKAKADTGVASSDAASTGAFLAIGGGTGGNFSFRSGAGKRAAEGEKRTADLLAAAQEAQRDEESGKTALAAAKDQLAQGVSAGRSAPRSDARAKNEGLAKQAADTAKKSYRIVDLTRRLQSFPGPDLDIPEPGNRPALPPVEPDVEPGVNELIEIIQRTIAPDSWGKEGTSIEFHDGQLMVTNTAEVQRQVDEFLATLRRQAGIRGLNGATDTVASMAFLRSDMTAVFNRPVGEALEILSGGMVVFRFSSSAERRFAQPAEVAMQNEPVARGIVRLARSAGLQVRLDGGVVQVDEATRPLDPSDAQGYTLPEFKDLLGTQPMQSIAVDPVQTVAIDADTASYEYAKARVASGQPVDPATIKPEHFINAMPMDYPAAQGPEAFSLFAEAAPSPFARVGTAWGARTAVVAIGAVAKPAAADERKPLALTLAIDCSGSMAQAGGLDRIRRGLSAFIDHLRAEDRVSIVAFGDQARVILPATPGNDRVALSTALANLVTGGATNAAEGLSLAYQLAAETAAAGSESRVLLATDGGTVAGADDLLRRVTAFKDRGITLVVVGTGQTYRAGPLQELASKGDGQHFYVGSDEDAEALFTGRLLPDRLAVLAKDAKLQVTWNPQRISHARLIGYDQRRLAAKDFRNNTVDAGELSQDTRVTALFEVLLVDGGTGPLGNAAVRYHDTRRGEVRELACPLPGAILASQASDRLRLLACAAATAEWLQRGWWSNVHLITPEEIRAQLARCPQAIANELRAMVK